MQAYLPRSLLLWPLERHYCQGPWGLTDGHHCQALSEHVLVCPGVACNCFFGERYFPFTNDVRLTWLLYVKALMEADSRQKWLRGPRAAFKVIGASLACCEAEIALITFLAPSPFRVKPVNPSGGPGLESGFSTLSYLDHPTISQPYMERQKRNRTRLCHKYMRSCDVLY